MNISDLRITKNLKYKALYWNLNYIEENEEDVFIKKINDLTFIIDSKNQLFFIQGTNIKIKLLNKRDFVVLEFINRILENGFNLEDIVLTESNIFLNKFRVSFFDWDEKFPTIKNDEIFYKSRLYSGIIESISTAKTKERIYENVEFVDSKIIFNNKTKFNFKNENFVVENGKLIQYKDNQKTLIVPEGVETIESCLFWDDQTLEEVVLPNSIVSLGGDTFYNCKKLKKINLPPNLQFMGNDPFAGCLKLNIENASNFFKTIDGVLYSFDSKKLIHYPANKKDSVFILPNEVEVIGKHAFFLCSNLEKIFLPKNLKRMENNPFSGCNKLSIENKSPNFNVINDVIYNKFKTTIIGVLSKIQKNNLEILDTTKVINRNSFWNCTGIKKIILPKSLEEIGYNPFVGCANIDFVSNSDNFKVKDGILYNKDFSKIICYPSWKTDKKVNILESVIELERGSFSGCKNIEKIDLHNVNKINKSTFTNCFNLKNIYCSDLITYIGEWAFAYCKNLKNISVHKDTFIEKNSFLNTNTKIIKRRKLTNYVIESDNLYSLISMQNKYKNEIKSIIIDPPYNSNINYIGYKDNNFDEGYVAFVEKRLDLAYKLLTKDGSLIINIDDGEVNNLFKICSKIFGNQNVTLHKWKKINHYFDKNRVIKNKFKVQKDYEYIILAKKNKKTILNKINQPYLNKNDIFQKQVEFPETFDFFGTTSSAKDEIFELFGNRDFFSTPKPIKLIKEFVRATSSKDSIVLDFFAGSGTLGHAVEDLNNEDGGNRKYILIKNNENNICRNVTVKRMKKINSKFKFLY